MPVRLLHFPDMYYIINELTKKIKEQFNIQKEILRKTDSFDSKLLIYQIVGVLPYNDGQGNIWVIFTQRH